MRNAVMACLVAMVVAGSGASLRLFAAGPATSLAVRITSPLGRTGLTGPVRLVAQVQHREKARLKPMKFYIDEKLFGEAETGPPFSLEWIDDNPFEPHEISAEVCDDEGECARDVVDLKPLEVFEKSGVSSVLLEASVQDRAGHYLPGLTRDDFSLAEDGQLQVLDLVTSDTVDSTYTLLIDCSQSMSRRMDFVQEAASRCCDFFAPRIACSSCRLRKRSGPSPVQPMIGAP